ncbi:unnamed protein product [Prunus brigantina]
MREEDVEKIVNNRLRNLKIGGNFKDALRREANQANSTPFTAEIEQTAPPKRFSTPSFKHFKGDSDPEGHLKNFKKYHDLLQGQHCRVRRPNRVLCFQEGSSS